jgi:hypothetical protein
MGKGKKPELEVVGAELCKCGGCKKTQARFSFCTEHYEWFKFGLISKAGARVSDFDKKFDHFTAYLEKQKHYKVA